MASKRAATIPEYIDAAPAEGQPHLNFTPTAEGLAPFHKALEKHRTTEKGMLQVRYTEALPEDLIRRIAEARVQAVREREDDAFW